MKTWRLNQQTAFINQLNSETEDIQFRMKFDLLNLQFSWLPLKFKYYNSNEM